MNMNCYSKWLLRGLLIQYPLFFLKTELKKIYEDVALDDYSSLGSNDYSEEPEYGEIEADAEATLIL